MDLTKKAAKTVFFPPLAKAVLNLFVDTLPFGVQVPGEGFSQNEKVKAAFSDPEFVRFGRSLDDTASCVPGPPSGDASVACAVGHSSGYGPHRLRRVGTSSLRSPPVLVVSQQDRLDVIEGRGTGLASGADAGRHSGSGDALPALAEVQASCDSVCSRSVLSAGAADPSGADGRPTVAHAGRPCDAGDGSFQLPASEVLGAECCGSRSQEGHHSRSLRCDHDRSRIGSGSCLSQRSVECVDTHDASDSMTQNSELGSSVNSSEFRNSRIQGLRSTPNLSSHACARTSARAVAGLSFASAVCCSRPARSLCSAPGAAWLSRSWAAVVASSCVAGDSVHVACANTGSAQSAAHCSSQDPRGTRGTKGGVSSASEDKNSDPKGTGTYLRTAGGVRGPVVGSSPGRRTVTKGERGAVTPSVHLGVSESLAVTPGHGLGLRQRLGWKKVCGTEWSGIWVLKGESRGYALPSTLDHLGVVWMEKRTYSTAWVTPTHACLCPYKYGRGAAVGPQSCSSIWNGVMGLWGRVAPLLTPWCSLRELPTGVNLNRYAGWGSSIPWHSDDEPLFGDQGDPKVIVSMSLGSSVDFRVRSRGRCNAPSSIRLDHGDLLVMDGLAQLEYEHSTSSELSGPRVNLTYRWISQHTPTCRSIRAGVCCALPSCAQGLPGLSSREGGGHF